MRRTISFLAVISALVMANADGIARAHPGEKRPQHVTGKLVCTAGDHRLVDGDRHPIDHDVVCEIDAGLEETLDGDLTGAIQLAMTEPFGGTANASATVTTDGGVWRGDAFGLGSDLLRCAGATFHATLQHGEDVVWEQTLHVKPSCPRVKLRKPAFDCRKIMHIDSTFVVVEEGKEPPPDSTPGRSKVHASIDCTVAIAGMPAGVTLSASFRRAADPDDIDTHPIDPDHLSATASYPPDEQACKAIRVDAVITRDGGVVWSGHSSYTPGCPPGNP